MQLILKYYGMIILLYNIMEVISLYFIIPDRVIFNNKINNYFYTLTYSGPNSIPFINPLKENFKKKTHERWTAVPKVNAALHLTSHAVEHM